MMNHETLVMLGADKLANIIMALRKGSSEVNLELDVVLAGAEETPDKLVDLLYKEIAALKNIQIFHTSPETDTIVIAKLDVLRKYITQNLRAMSASKAMELLLTFFDTYEDVMYNTDDYEGLVDEVFVEAYHDLKQLCKHVKPSAKALADAIAKKCINKPDDTCCRLILEFKNALQEQESEEVLDLLRERVEQSLKDGGDKCTVENRIDLLKNLAEMTQNVNAYIEACNINGAPDSSVCIAIAEQLMAQQCAVEALTWLKKVSDSDKKDNSRYEETYDRAVVEASEEVIFMLIFMTYARYPKFLDWLKEAEYFVEHKYIDQGLSYLLSVWKYNEAELEKALKSAPEKLKDKILGAVRNIEDKGRKEGRKEGKQEIARHMLSKGYDILEVEQVTGLSRQELASLAGWV